MSDSNDDRQKLARQIADDSIIASGTGYRLKGGVLGATLCSDSITTLDIASTRLASMIDPTCTMYIVRSYWDYHRECDVYDLRCQECGSSVNGYTGYLDRVGYCMHCGARVTNVYSDDNTQWE